MEAVKVKLEDILSCEEIPIVRLKSDVINALVIGYHVYKENWTPSIGYGFLFFRVFYFLKSGKKHYCKITLTEKATIAGDGSEMKVPCQLF